MATFSGNVDLLVTSPTFQEALVDKDGTAMAGGIVTCYHDNSRTTLKNWYYQTGTPGAYTYIALPNPLTLSSAGSVTDINGVDTMPFFYPYSELTNSINDPDPYYITIVNHDMTNQITRANFPFLGIASGNTNFVNSVNNLVVNAGFWRNILPNTVNSANLSTTLTNVTNLVVAPSQHDTFRMPDIQFIKNITGAVETVTFIPFPLTNTQPILNDIVPEYYLQHQCTAPTTGETQKCYQFPISAHVNTLASVPFTVSIQAQNGGSLGTGQNVIKLFILQDLGTGVSSPVPVEIDDITLNSSWTTYSFTGELPPTAGLTLSNGADDGLYLQVQMPLNLSCTINFTKPSIYLTTGIIPNNQIQTYDQVDTIINSPRTGDIRTSLNSFYPYGWVSMNNGSIGNGSSNASTRNNADTWNLFNLLWNYFANFNTATRAILAPMFTSAGASVDYGGSAIADFNANRQLTLTQTMGKVILGTVPTSAYLGTYTSAFSAVNIGGNLVISSVNTLNVFNGMPVYFIGGSLPASLTVGTVYYVANFDGVNSFGVSTTFANAIAGVIIGFAAGSGTFFAAGTGTFEGEYNHLQLLSELVNHTHDPLIAGTTYVMAQTGGSGTISPSGTINPLVATTGLVTNAPDTQLRSNVTQPGVFFNMYIKL